MLNPRMATTGCWSAATAILHFTAMSARFAARLSMDGIRRIPVAGNAVRESAPAVHAAVRRADIFPAGKEIMVGQKTGIGFKGGASRVMLVTGVSEADVIPDGNHPLAGCGLTFALRVDRVE